MLKKRKLLSRSDMEFSEKLSFGTPRHNLFCFSSIKECLFSNYRIEDTFNIFFDECGCSTTAVRHLKCHISLVGNIDIDSEYEVHKTLTGWGKTIYLLNRVDTMRQARQLVYIIAQLERFYLFLKETRVKQQLLHSSSFY